MNEFTPSAFPSDTSIWAWSKVLAQSSVHWAPAGQDYLQGTAADTEIYKRPLTSRKIKIYHEADCPGKGLVAKLS